MVYECLDTWRLCNIEKENSAVLIFHTSCVNYTMEDLKKIASLKFQWMFPEDVLYELRLLTHSKIFGIKAQYLLQQQRRFKSLQKQWDLSQIYDTSSSKISSSQIFHGSMIFLFGDLNKLDEFIKHAIPDDHMYVMILSENWSCIKGTAVILPLKKVAPYQTRKAIRLIPGRNIEKINDLHELHVNRLVNDVLDGADFEATGKCGSNAHIYTCGRFPDMYIKAYKQFHFNGSSKDKLVVLQKFGLRVQAVLQKHELPSLALNAAFPVDLIYDNPNSVIGYTMYPISGKLLREYLMIGWEGHDLEHIFHQLLLLILELHTMHILINDLSFNNILIDSSDHVGIVDCDSFQIVNYPGGGITPIYQHPEIKDEGFSETLREPRHEYFALAVLLFQCLFYDEPLRQSQDSENETELTWKNAEFPFDINNCSLRANQNMKKIWFSQPYNLRKLFSDEFHFREDVSIGTWIRELGIEKN